MNNPLFTFENLHRAWESCRENKRGSLSALAFELNAEQNLLELHEQLEARTYKPRPSESSLFDQIPAYKSLFHTGNKTGLPIGNYTSQFFANVYLNDLDQFVKRDLRCRFYIRYVDDLLLLDRDRRQLLRWEEDISGFLKEKLKIQFNEKRRKIATVRSGCDFLGYIVRPTHLLVRKRTVNNLKSKLAEYEKRLIRHEGNIEIISFDPPVVDKLHATLASYLGQFSHASTHNLVDFLFYRHSFLKNYFLLADGKVWRKDVPPRFSSLKRQYNWFCKNHPRLFIFFQIGCFYEFYGCQAVIARALFGLSPGPRRPYLGERHGFRVGFGDRHVKKAVEELPYVAIVRQTGRLSGRVAERRFRTFFLKRNARS